MNIKTAPKETTINRITTVGNPNVIAPVNQLHAIWLENVTVMAGPGKPAYNNGYNEALHIVC